MRVVLPSGRRRDATGRRARPLAALALAALALGLACAPARAEETVDGPRVRVVSTVGSKDAALRCRDALEAAIPVYEAHLPYRMPADARLVLHLYAKPEEYEAAVTAAGAPLLARHGAATVASTAETHVTLRPRDDPAYLAAVGGLSERTRFVVVHEGVHQFLRRAGAAHTDFWPDWYGEGMAEWLAAECLRVAGGPAAKPFLVVDDARHRVQDALRRDRMQRLPALLHGRVSAFENLSSFYTHAAELYRLLAADPARLRRLHEAVRDVKPPDEGTWDARQMAVAKAFEAALVKAYGPLRALEESWRAQVRAAKPRWFEDGRCNEFVGDEVVSAGTPGWNAILLSAEPAPGAPFSLSFEMNLLPLGDRQADVCLAYEHRDEPRFLKIALGPGYATLLAFSDGRWQDRFRRNADVEPGACAPGKWIPVRVRVDRERIRVESGGAVLLEASVPPGFDPLGGSWGVGTTDSACRFRGLKIEK